jgi:hypothetical protein
VAAGSAAEYAASLAASYAPALGLNPNMIGTAVSNAVGQYLAAAS